MGYVGYFLITRDIVSAARKMGVMVGPGRGSAAGSIIAYSIDITRIDPLRYDLIFERFLNQARVSMPDIDIDFSADGRNRVLDYILGKYGSENVCQIITFGSLGAKMVVRDVGRAMNIPLNEVNEITQKIPTKPGITLEKALKISPRLQKLINSKYEYQELMKYSQVLQGLPRHSGVHAAGVVIAPDKLMKFVPLAKNMKEDVVISQYEGKWLGTIKMLKMDILGLKNLTVIEKTQEFIKQNHGVEIDIDNIDKNDITTYEMLCRGETDGVFQFEGSGMRDVLQRIKPNSIDDLAACTALYRPGPLGSGMHEAFIRRKNGEEEVSYLHPLIEEILEDTYGVIVYQEQVMQIAHKLAGFTLSEADILRKAMSKKIKTLMAKFETQFIEGAVKKGVNRELAEKIYGLIKQFGQYGFNKSHSVAYSVISYQTAYLKANYPAEYMAALMSIENDNDKIANSIDVCKKMDIEVVSPDVNTSDLDFVVKNGIIYFGLKAIKNVGKNSIQSITENREQAGKFSNIYELCAKVSSSCINKTTLESLISAGAMDSLEGNRAEQFDAIEKAIEYGSNISKEKTRGQASLFENIQEDKSEKYPPLNKFSEWRISYKLQKEKELLGIYFSGHPLLKYKKEIELFSNINTKSYKQNRKKTKNKVTYRIFGLVNDIVIKRDKNNQEMAFIQAEDLYDKFEVIVFASLFQRYKVNELNEGKILFFIGYPSNKNSNNNQCKFIARDILPMEKLPRKLSGDIYIFCKQENFDESILDTLIEKYFENNYGNFRVHLKIKQKILAFWILSHKNIRSILQEIYFPLLKKTRIK